MISRNKLILAGSIIIVAISLAGLGVWLWSLKAPTNNNINTANTNISNINATLNENADSQQLNANSAQIDTSDWQTYRNEELGFEVKIPESWDKSNIKDEKVDQEVSRVAFSKLVEDINDITNTSTTRMFNFLTILVSSKEWWDKELGYNTPHPTFIQSIDNKVYSYACCQDGNEEEINIISNVVRTFRLLVAGQ